MPETIVHNPCLSSCDDKQIDRQRGRGRERVNEERERREGERSVERECEKIRPKKLDFFSQKNSIT
jgi:hypothetical protein